MLPILFAAYGAVFVAEITGDKLLYTTGVLATRYRTAPILCGMAIAFMADGSRRSGRQRDIETAASGGSRHDHGQLLRHCLRSVAQARPRGIEDRLPGF